MNFLLLHIFKVGIHNLISRRQRKSSVRYLFDYERSGLMRKKAECLRQRLRLCLFVKFHSSYFNEMDMSGELNGWLKEYRILAEVTLVEIYPDRILYFRLLFLEQCDLLRIK